MKSAGLSLGIRTHFSLQTFDSHKYNLNCAAVLTAWFKSYLYCCGDIRNVCEAKNSITFLWFVVYWQSDLKSVYPNVTTDFMCRTYTFYKCFVSWSVQLTDTKYESACYPLRELFSSLGIFNMMPRIPELQPLLKIKKILGVDFCLTECTTYISKKMLQSSF
jgi:hypothetical protein